MKLNKWKKYVKGRDRLGPYTESDLEILQVTNTVEEEGERERFTWSINACKRKKKKEERRVTNIAKKEKSEG